MTDDVRLLVRNVITGNRKGALASAQVIIASDKSQKDVGFCARMREEMDKVVNDNVPADLNGVLIMGSRFNRDRYFVTSREQVIMTRLKSIYESSDKLNAMGIDYNTSLMLYGDSGCGKTEFAKCIAHDLDLPFYYVNIAQLISSYLGSTGRNIAKVFNFIKERKCVCLFDEVDSIAISRSSSDNNETYRIIGTLIQEIDNVGNNPIVICATNVRDKLDGAVNGRFRLQHNIARFNSDEIYAMIKAFISTTPLTISEDLCEKWALKYRGYTNRNIMNMLVEEIAKCVQRGETELTEEI